MKKLILVLAFMAALLLTAWTTYRATMRRLVIETAPGGVVYVTAWGLTDVYSVEGATE